MRVVRTILGILLLTIGLPLLLVGGALWMAMQHRDAGGAFSGELEDIKTKGYAVVVPDVDGLLQRQAPFARSEQTRLRVTAQTGAEPAFIGMARPAEAARFLAGVSHTRVEEVKLARGALPVRTVAVAGEAEPATGPGSQEFWVRSGTGSLEWNPSATRGEQLALVVMSVDGDPPQVVSASAELRPGWLNSSTWGLLVLGSVMLLLGIVCLAWPIRSREVVYVVDPAQLPDIAARLGVPVPAPTAAGSVEPVSAGRPATLAESAATGTGAGAPPVVPRLAWPPVPAGETASDPAPAAAAAGVLAPEIEPVPGAEPLPGSDPTPGGEPAPAGEPRPDDDPVPAEGGPAAVPAASVPAASVPAASVPAASVPAARTAADADQDTTAGPAVATGGPGQPGAKIAVPPAAVPPAVVAPRSGRRRRASAADEANKAAGEDGVPAPGAGVAAALGPGGRRPSRPRGSGKSKSGKSDTDQPVA